MFQLVAYGTFTISIHRNTFSDEQSQQLCGINAVFYYSTMFFDGLIDNPLLGTTIVGAVNVVATYAALLLMESSNRRSLLLWSSGGMLLSSIGLVLCLLGFFTKIASLLCVVAYVVSVLV